MRTLLAITIGAGLLVGCGGEGGPGQVSMQVVETPVATAGVVAELTVGAEYAGGGFQEDFTGRVVFTSSDHRAVLPETYTFTAADRGRRTFSFEFRTAGEQTLTMRVLGGTLVKNTTTEIEVRPAPQTGFRLDLGTEQPGAHGAPFGRIARVVAVDRWGNTTPDFDAGADPVTITCTPNDGTFAGLGGVEGNVLGAGDFVDGVADLAGRFTFHWRRTGDPVHTFTATAQSGLAGTSTPIEVVTNVGVKGFARYIDMDRDGFATAGDLLVVPFERPLTRADAAPDAFAFSQAKDSLGDGASVRLGPGDHELTIVLGAAARLRTRALFGESSKASGIALAAGLDHFGIRDAFGLPGGASDHIDVAPGFAPTTQFLGAADTRAMATGDLDGDGDKDLVCANYGSPSCVYLNDGAGRFSLARTLTDGGTANSVALGDIDQDGDLDFVLGNDGGNSLWRNNGSAVFTQDPGLLGQRPTLGLVLVDLDRDADLDLVAANDGQDRVWWNDGSGSFTDSGQALGAARTSLVTTLDANRDGRPDLLFVGGGMRIWTNDGAGGFIAGNGFGAAVTAAGLGDLDGDGDFDIVAGSASGMRVWSNDGGGSFTSGDLFFVEGGVGCIGVTDLDRNGWPDVVGGGRIWFNAGGGELVDAGYDLGVCTTFVVGNVDADGDDDLILGGDGANTVWAGSLSGTYGEIRDIDFVAQGLGTTSLAVRVVDIDRDGDLDLLTTTGDVVHVFPQFFTEPRTPGNRENTIWRNGGDGTFSPEEGLFADENVTAFALGDVNGDGRLDAVTASPTVDKIWPGRDGGGFGTPTILPTSGTVALALVDMDKDGDLDLVRGSTSGLVIHYGNGGLTFSAAGSPLSGARVQAIAVADVNGDGALDVAVADGGCHVQLGDGRRSFTVRPVTAPATPSYLQLADVDRDGDLDLVLAASLQPNSIFLNDGKGVFTDTFQRLGKTCTNVLALVDLDCDGDLDMVEGNDSVPDVIWVNDGKGNFTDTGKRLPPGSTFAYGVGDFDRDGATDFFHANWGWTASPNDPTNDQIYWNR